MSQEFGSELDEKKERTESKYRKTDYLKLDEGEHTVRVLDTRETKHYTHYVGFAYVKCLDDECPICQNNKRILFDHPEDFREVKGWNPRRDRYYINVIDKTPTKVCSKCATEATVSSAACPACGTVLGDAAPLNKVKVLTGSRRLFEDLKVLYKTVRDEGDNIVDIRLYDWILVTRGKKTDKVTSPSPRYYPNKAVLPEFNPEDLFDLSRCAIELNPTEMLDLFNGASLKDIFTMRRASKQEDTTTIETSEDISEEISASIDDIFKA
jgi:hypothetical protein